MLPLRPLRKPPAVNVVFAGLWLFIIFVSVHDAYLALLYEAQLKDFELNPMGQYLLNLAQGRVWALVAVKSLGTVLAASGLLVLFKRRKHWGLVAAAVVAAFQLGLLVFLTVDWRLLQHLGLLD